MLLSTEINVPMFSFLKYYFPVLIIVFTVFSAIAGKKHLESKTKMVFSYLMNNLVYLILFAIMEIGIVNALNNGYKTDLYQFSLLAMNVGIVLSSMFYYLFYATITEKPDKIKNIMKITAISICAFMLILWPDWFADNATGGMRLIYIAQLLQSIYCIYIYFVMSKELFRLSKKVKVRTRELRALAFSSVMMLVFFFMMLIRIWLTNLPGAALVFLILTWVAFSFAIIGNFIGFMLPNLSSKGKTKKLRKSKKIIVSNKE